MTKRLAVTFTAIVALAAVAVAVTWAATRDDRPGPTAGYGLAPGMLGSGDRDVVGPVLRGHDGRQLRRHDERDARELGESLTEEELADLVAPPDSVLSRASAAIGRGRLAEDAAGAIAS